MSGMTLDTDTLCLYKFLEPPLTESPTDTAVAGTKDATANNYHLSPFFDSSALAQAPAVVWGPRGPTVRTQFARYFFANGQTHCNLRSAVIDQDFIDAQITDHTWQVYFKSDENTSDNAIFAVGDDFSVATASDWLLSVTILSNGNIRLFWESQNADQTYDVTGITVLANTWHTLMVSRRTDPLNTNNFITRVYFDGGFVEEFDLNDTWVSGNGLKPISTSGTSDVLVLGASDASNNAEDFNGAIAGLRCVELALTDTQIVNDHNDWISNGVLVLDNHGANTTLCQYNLDERPDFLDESPNGLHATKRLYTGTMNTYEGTDVCDVLDIVGTNGVAYHNDNIGLLFSPHTNSVEFVARNGRELYQFFNDDIDIPEWTVEFYGVFDSRAPGLSAWSVLDIIGGSGAGADANVLALSSINTSTLIGKNDYERGTDVSVATVTPGAVISNNEQHGVMHVALRHREDPSMAGNVITEFFINGVLIDTTNSDLPAQNGGQFRQYFRCLVAEGYMQEFKLSKVAVSDAQILANAQAIGEATPQIVTVTPPSGTTIPDDQILEFDVVSDVGIPVSVTLIWLKYAEQSTSTVVYDGASFLPPFTGTITDTLGDGSSLHFKIIAEGRWRNDIEEMRVRVLGTNGILDVEI